jgi:hypothetical protein
MNTHRRDNVLLSGLALLAALGMLLLVAGGTAHNDPEAIGGGVLVGLVLVALGILAASAPRA